MKQAAPGGDCQRCHHIWPLFPITWWGILTLGQPFDYLTRYRSSCNRFEQHKPHTRREHELPQDPKNHRAYFTRVFCFLSVPLKGNSFFSRALQCNKIGMPSSSKMFVDALQSCEKIICYQAPFTLCAPMYTIVSHLADCRSISWQTLYPPFSDIYWQWSRCSSGFPPPKWFRWRNWSGG